MNAQASLDRLSTCLSRLPGVGRRSAERMAMRLVRERDGLLKELRDALEAAHQHVRCCSLCGSVTPAESDPCRLCTGADRDDATLCVVEDPGDVVLIERSGGYRGRYHALMGRLSPMKGDGVEDLRVRSLVERVRQGTIKEVVLALSTDVEGDATASYLAEVLSKQFAVTITRLAFGLPAGSGVLYSDPVTLARAIRGRQEA